MSILGRLFGTPQQAMRTSVEVAELSEADHAAHAARLVGRSGSQRSWEATHADLLQANVHAMLAVHKALQSESLYGNLSSQMDRLLFLAERR